MKKARFEKLYTITIRSALQKKLKLKNNMEVPRIEKIVLNIGVKEAVADSKYVQWAIDGLSNIAGQQVVKRLARKSIAGFKLRKGVPIGVMVTLRRKKMYEFLDKLVNVALPKIRNFQGVSRTFDGQGNYNLGISEWVIFPEVEYDVGKKIYGLNISMHTTAQRDDYGLELLQLFGIPFKKRTG